MTKFDEDTALAILFANTKRKKRTEDLVTIAQACEFLVDLYGTQKAVAKKVGLSSEMIREFRKILTLPKKVKDMVRARKIDLLDVAYRISMLDDSKKKIEVAKQIAELPSDDVRDIKRLISKVGLSARDSKKKVLESKLRGLHVFVVDFDDREYRKISSSAKRRKIEPAELIRKIVLDCLKDEDK